MAISKEEKELLEDIETFIAVVEIYRRNDSNVSVHTQWTSRMHSKDLRARAGATQEETEIQERVEEREEDITLRHAAVKKRLQ